MLIDIDCIYCDKEFEGREWTNGKCPNCGAKYSWDEMVTEDDSWSLLDWEKNDPKKTPD